MLLSLLWAQQDAVSDTLPQYGAIGAIALVCIWGFIKIFNRLVAQHQAELDRIQTAHKNAIDRADAAYDKEVSRGDRLESELRELNKLVNDKLAGELVRATDAIREAWGNVHDQHRGRS
ncbi:hypothetical protein [Nocardia spumae]|uniref:hypothetical protein n=1 Tax=Nocardia spumae TaxID=2887190 RepID=UPI001D15B676|nr:hypothetical protein [Nocardia spumae]